MATAEQPQHRHMPAAHHPRTTSKTTAASIKHNGATGQNSCRHPLPGAGRNKAPAATPQSLALTAP